MLVSPARALTEIPTLGVEMEYQIIDPETRELSSESRGLLEEGAAIHGDHIRPEFHAPVVECVTGVCRSVSEVRGQIAELRRTVIQLARKHGLEIAAASTHPFTHWEKVKLTPGERYEQIQKDLGDVARANLIYGMHCHLGIVDPEARIAVMNAARYFVPHLLALSCSSPFWQGRDSGLASVRTGIFRRFPRTGIPDFFSSYGEFQSYVETLVATGSIQNAKNIYWDIRPHPFYPTIEFRGCDVPTKLSSVSAIVALIHLVGTRLVNLHHRNLTYRLHRRAYINENMYRAMRHGIRGSFIDLATKRVVPTVDAIKTVLDDVSEETRLLGLDAEVQTLHQMLEDGDSAERQRRVYAESGSLETVVDRLIEETAQDVA